MGKSDFMSWRVIRVRTDDVRNESFGTPGGDQSNERFRSEEICGVVAIALPREQREGRLVRSRRTAPVPADFLPVTRTRFPQREF
jgi:hypothetical protein